MNMSIWLLFCYSGVWLIMLLTQSPYKCVRVGASDQTDRQTAPNIDTSASLSDPDCFSFPEDFPQPLIKLLRNYTQIVAAHKQ